MWTFSLWHVEWGWRRGCYCLIISVLGCGVWILFHTTWCLLTISGSITAWRFMPRENGWLCCTVVRRSGGKWYSLFYTTWRLLPVSGRITAWRFMPKENGGLYCTVVRGSGSGEYSLFYTTWHLLLVSGRITAWCFMPRENRRLYCAVVWLLGGQDHFTLHGTCYLFQVASLLGASCPKRTDVCIVRLCDDLVDSTILHYMTLVICFRSHHCLVLHAQREWAVVLRGCMMIGWTVPFYTTWHLFSVSGRITAWRFMPKENCCATIVQWTVPFYTTWHLLSVSGRITAWRFMPKENGRLYCAVVWWSGGQYHFTLHGACYLFQVASLLGASCPERMDGCVARLCDDQGVNGTLYFTLHGACYLFQVASLLGASCPKRTEGCIAQLCEDRGVESTLYFTLHGTCYLFQVASLLGASCPERTDGCIARLCEDWPDKTILHYMALVICFRSHHCLALHVQRERMVVLCSCVMIGWTVPFYTTWHLLSVSGRITAWRFMPKENGRLYCAVVWWSGGQYHFTLHGACYLFQVASLLGVSCPKRTDGCIARLCDDRVDSTILHYMALAICFRSHHCLALHAQREWLCDNRAVDSTILHYMALAICFRSHHCLAFHAQRERTVVLCGCVMIGWTVPFYTTWCLLSVSGRITAWRFMPKENGRLYCAVVWWSGGQYHFTLHGACYLFQVASLLGVSCPKRTDGCIARLCDDRVDSTILHYMALVICFRSHHCLALHAQRERLCDNRAVDSTILHYMALVICFRSHHCLAFHAQRERTVVLRGCATIGWTVHSGGSQRDTDEPVQDRRYVGKSS